MPLLAEVEATHALPMPAWLFPVVALAVFGLLLVITLSYRGMWHRHDPAAFDSSHGGHESSSSSGSGHH